MDNTSAIFVALAPAFAVAIVGFIVEVVPGLLQRIRVLVTRMRRWTFVFFASQPMTQWLLDLVHGATLLGTSVAAILGLKQDSPETLMVAAAWAVFSSTISFKLSRQLERLKDRESERSAAREKRQHRKMAGTVRSIVKDELAKVSADREAPN